MNASRRIAILEAVLILLPLTILAALGTLWSGPPTWQWQSPICGSTC